MAEQVYWYISKSKVDALKNSPLSMLDEITAKFDFALRPFLSGSLSTKTLPSVKRDLRRLDRSLRSKYSIKPYQEIGKGDAPVWFAFQGTAVRKVTPHAYWIGMQHDDIGLVLGGSARYAIGSQAEADPNGFQVSVDPVTALSKLLQKGSSIKKSSSALAATQLAFAWGTIMNGVPAGGVLPRAEGLAIFAGAFPLDDACTKAVEQGGRSAVILTRSKRPPQSPKIKMLVVGTALYIRQI